MQYIYSFGQQRDEGIPTVSINKINKTGSEPQTDKTLNAKKSIKSENEIIVVDIKGAVKYPNIYEMSLQIESNSYKDKFWIMQIFQLLTLQKSCWIKK